MNCIYVQAKIKMICVISIFKITGQLVLAKCSTSVLLHFRSVAIVADDVKAEALEHPLLLTEKTGWKKVFGFPEQINKSRAGPGLGQKIYLINEPTCFLWSLG